MKRILKWISKLIGVNHPTIKEPLTLGQKFAGRLKNEYRGSIFTVAEESLDDDDDTLMFLHYYGFSEIAPCDSVNVKKEAEVITSDGWIGIVEECEDLHNVSVKYEAGGGGLYCLDPLCEEKDNNLYIFI